MATICLPNFEPGHYLVLATRNGIVKKTPLEQFEQVRSTGSARSPSATTTSSPGST